MNINLKTIYETLDNIIPEFSILLSQSIKRIQIIKKDTNEANFISTLAIDYTGTIYISEEFWEKYLQNESSLGAVLLHELYHDITGDTVILLREFNKIKNNNTVTDEQKEAKFQEFELRKLAYNIAMDCRINASIYLTSTIDEPGRLFKELYTKEHVKESPILALLSPYTEEFIPEPELLKEYQAIYARSEDEICSFRQLYELVFDYLNRNQEQNKKIIIKLLLGNHGDKDDPNNPCKGQEVEISEELKEKIKQYIEDNSEMNKTAAGDMKDFMEGRKVAGKTNKNISEALIEDYKGVDQKLNLNYFKSLSFNSIMSNVRLEMDNYGSIKTKSVLIPSVLSRLDMFRMMIQDIPLSWDIAAFVPVKTDRKIPIYLDVSGSMHSHLPKIVNLLLNIKDDIDYVWGFSELVHKHTMEELAARKLKTTGGTSFDCIIEHALENNFRNLLVITDGYADCRIKNGEFIPEIDSVTTVLCTSSRTEENYFCKTYNPVVQIEDITVEHV